MLKLTYVCDKCGVKSEREYINAREIDTINWRNAPDLWISVGVDDKVLYLCPNCNGDVVRSKDSIVALEAQIKTDATAAVAAKVEG